MQLFNSQLALFKVEIEEEANTFARGAIMIGVGAVVAAIGFALLNVAAWPSAVSTLFAAINLSQPASYGARICRNRSFLSARYGCDCDPGDSTVDWRNSRWFPERTVAELRKGQSMAEERTLGLTRSRRKRA